MGKKYGIIHFSDLHIGCGDFEEQYMNNVIKYIRLFKNWLKSRPQVLYLPSVRPAIFQFRRV